MKFENFLRTGNDIVIFFFFLTQSKLKVDNANQLLYHTKCPKNYNTQGLALVNTGLAIPKDLSFFACNLGLNFHTFNIL